MPIQFTRAYQTSDGQTHASLENAQRHELLAIFESEEGQHWTPPEIVGTILGASETILAILSQKERQRVRAAKPSSRGVSKKRNGRASSLGATLPPSKESAADAPPLFGKDAA